MSNKAASHDYINREFSAVDFHFDAPKLDLDQIKDQLLQSFELVGAMTPLDGERDQNHRLVCEDGTQYVVKVSHKEEDPAVIDFQIKALSHIARKAPDIIVPRTVETLNGADVAYISGEQGIQHCLRVMTWVDGAAIDPEKPIAQALLAAVASNQALVAKALKDFEHPAADHFMAWDIKRALVSNPSVQAKVDQDALELARPYLERFTADALPKLGGLRQQVIHGDGHSGNILQAEDSQNTVAGLIDFGDMVRAPLVQDLAVTIASFSRLGDGSIDNALIQLEAWHREYPLEPAEIDLLYDLICLRLVTALFLYDFRRNSIADGPPWLLTERPDIIRSLTYWLGLDGDDVRRQFYQICTKSILDKRHKTLAPSYRLFYSNPVHIVRGEGVFLWDAEGQRYLDCYNNVASVGHCHPDVVAALNKQAGTLNTHTRYLHPSITQLSDRICKTMPDGLDTCFFVCTGTEANDLAVRLARSFTGNEGVIVSEGAYHGNSCTVSRLSTCMYPADERPNWVACFEPPDPEQAMNTDTQADDIACPISELGDRGAGVAAVMVDTIFDAPGPFTAPNGYLERLAMHTRAAGGIVIADEVQAGFGRLGETFWGFARSDMVPDIVTLGKPMGAGHPIAAVITRREIAEAFAEKSSYFNTFGGNPVSCEVALSVLDIIQRDDLQANARTTGRYLMQKLEALTRECHAIKMITGEGLFLGLVMQCDEGRPSEDRAYQLMNAMRDHGVLLGRTGRQDHVVKIRPPLVFKPEHADILIDALKLGLTELK